MNRNYNFLFLSRAHDRSKGKTQNSARAYSCGKFTGTHTPQFFQPMLLNSKFLHKKVRSKWSFFLCDKGKNKSESRAYLSFLT